MQNLKKYNFVIILIFFKGSLLISQNIKYTQDEYNIKCIKVINEAREEFHKKLPYLVENNLKIIKNDISSKLVEKTNSTTNREFLIKYEEINYGTFLSLLKNEQIANEIYYKYVNKLSEINSDFFNYYYAKGDTLKLKDFYNLPNIKLAEEVTIYLEDALKKEKDRVSRENKAMSFTIGLSIIELIPGAAAVTKILEGVKIGAKSAKMGVKAADNTTLISKMTTKFLTNKERASAILKSLSNAEKRAKISARIAYVGSAAMISNTALTFITESDATIEEKINEFSKGMTAVYLQNLREFVKINEKIILENEK